MGRRWKAQPGNTLSALLYSTPCCFCLWPYSWLPLRFHLAALYPSAADVLVGEVLAEVHQEGDLPHQVVGQEGDHLGLTTATMVSPDLSVEILELPPSLEGLAWPGAS